MPVYLRCLVVDIGSQDIDIADVVIGWFRHVKSDTEVYSLIVCAVILMIIAGVGYQPCDLVEIIKKAGYMSRLYLQGLIIVITQTYLVAACSFGKVLATPVAIAAFEIARGILSIRRGSSGLGMM